MRVLLAAALAAALALTACGGDGDGATSSAAPSTTAAGGEAEGEERDADARFGEDVCTALLPALDGETEGLERYATDEVLAVLAEDAELGPRAADATVWSDADDTCSISAGGDAWIELALEGDGHVGHRATDATHRVSADAGGGADIDAAVAAYRAGGEACEGEAGDGDTHEALALEGGTVVAILCEMAAYQGRYELRGWENGTLVDLRVEHWAEEGTRSAIVVGAPYEEAGLLHNVEKARGAGDCGVYQQWELDGRTLRLVAAWARGCDDPSEPTGPEDWPQVHPSD